MPMMRSAPTIRFALDDVQADAAEAEDGDVRAGFDLGRIHHRAEAGGDAAADVADLVERRVLADLRERDLRYDGVVREGRCAHVVQQRLAAEREPRTCRPASAPGPASRGSRRRDWFCLTGRTCTVGTPAYIAESRGPPTARSVTPGPVSTTTPGAFVAENGRKHAFRVGAGQGVGIRVADAGRLDLGPALRRSWARQGEPCRWQAGRPPAVAMAALVSMQLPHWRTERWFSVQGLANGASSGRDGVELAYSNGDSAPTRNGSDDRPPDVVARGVHVQHVVDEDRLGGFAVPA